MSKILTFFSDKLRITKNATSILDIAMDDLTKQIDSARIKINLAINPIEKLERVEKKLTKSSKDVAAEIKKRSDAMEEAKEKAKELTKKEKELNDELDRDTTATHIQKPIFVTEGQPPGQSQPQIGQQGGTIPQQPDLVGTPLPDTAKMRFEAKERKAKEDFEQGLRQAREDFEERKRRAKQAFLRKKQGGFIEPLEAQTGRHFPGYGGGDKIPALLEAGEFVLRKEAVRKMGLSAITAINKMDLSGLLANLTAPIQKLQEGGIVKPQGSSETINLNLSLERKTLSTTAPRDPAKKFFKDLKRINIIHGRAKRPY